MTDVKLKLCPFCGGKDININTEPNLYDELDHGPMYFAECDTCMVRTPHFWTVADAAESWNERAKAEKIEQQADQRHDTSSLLTTAADTIQRLGAAAQDCKNCANLTLCNAYKDGDSFKGCNYKWVHADDYTAEWIVSKTGHTICSACGGAVKPEHAKHFEFCPYCGKKIKKESKK